MSFQAWAQEEDVHTSNRCQHLQHLIGGSKPGSWAKKTRRWFLNWKWSNTISTLKAAASSVFLFLLRELKNIRISDQSVRIQDWDERLTVFVFSHQWCSFTHHVLLYLCNTLMINSLETKSEGNSTYNTINNKQNITKEMEDTYTKNWSCSMNNTEEGPIKRPNMARQSMSKAWTWKEDWY